MSFPIIRIDKRFPTPIQNTLKIRFELGVNLIFATNQKLNQNVVYSKDMSLMVLYVLLPLCSYPTRNKEQ